MHQAPETRNQKLDTIPQTLLLRFHPTCSVVEELEGDLVALLADKDSLAGLPDVVAAHVHAVIPAMVHLAAFPLPADRA